MESKLKEINPILYFLCQKDNISKIYDIVLNLTNAYKINDESLTELIIELRNKIIREDNKENIFYLKKIINLASEKLIDATQLIEVFSNSEKEIDFNFLLNIIENRFSNNNFEEDLVMLINHILNNQYFKKIINDNLTFKKSSHSLNLERLTKIILFSDNYDLLKQILYSRYINDLTPSTLIKLVIYISKKENKTFTEVFETINYKQDINQINNLVKVTNDVLDLYDNFYVKYNNSDSLVEKDIVYNSEEVLKSYDEETLEMYIDSLNHNYINHRHFINKSYDIMSAMLRLNKKNLALEVFNKPSYQPINKTLRKKVLDSKDNRIEEFAHRLNNNIQICLKYNYYDLLFEIISAKKIDSLHVGILYQIIQDIEIYKKISNENNELGQLIIDTILYRISTDELIIYRTLKQVLDKNFSNVLTKEGALALINEIIYDPETTIEELLDHKPERWARLIK